MGSVYTDSILSVMQTDPMQTLDPTHQCVARFQATWKGHIVPVSMTASSHGQSSQSRDEGTYTTVPYSGHACDIGQVAFTQKEFFPLL